MLIGLAWLWYAKKPSSQAASFSSSLAVRLSGGLLSISKSAAVCSADIMGDPSACPDQKLQIHLCFTASNSIRGLETKEQEHVELHFVLHDAATLKPVNKSPFYPWLLWVFLQCPALEGLARHTLRITPAYPVSCSKFNGKLLNATKPVRSYNLYLSAQLMLLIGI